MSNWFAAQARSNKSTTFGNISFATLNDKLKCIGFFGDLLRPGSPVDTAHNYDIEINYNAVGLDVINDNGVHRTIGGNDSYGLELQYSFYISFDNLVALAAGSKLKLDDQKDINEDDFVAPITEKWLRDWYNNLLLTFDLYRFNTRSISIYKNASWFTNMLSALSSHNVAMFISHMLTCLRRDNGYAGVPNSIDTNIERTLPNFCYKKGDTYYVIPAEPLNNHHLYGACVKGLLFKTYRMRPQYIYYADTNDSNEYRSNGLQTDDHTISEFHTSSDDKLVTVLAGIVYDTIESRCNVIMNHSAYNRVCYVGLPYIRISEGGADEASYYAIASTVHHADLQRSAHAPLMGERFDLKQQAGYLRNMLDVIPHARSWLLGSSRSLVDSVLTTVFNAAAGATLSGGLSADVVALLARHNTADVICAYTPVTNDPIMTQLTPGHFCGTVLYELVERGRPNNMYVTSRNSPRGRETIYVLHENGLVVGNHLARTADGQIIISDPYDENYVRQFESVDLDVVTARIDAPRNNNTRNEARRRNAALWS